MFTTVDVILLAVVLGLTVVGFVLGFVSSLGTLIGTIGGIIVASRVAPAISSAVHGNAVVTVVLFIIIELIVSRLIGLLFWFVNRTYKIVAIIPFVKSINHLLGGILGFIEGLILVAATAYVAKQVLPSIVVVSVIDSSKVATQLLSIFDFLKALLPSSLQSKVPL